MAFGLGIASVVVAAWGRRKLGTKWCLWSEHFVLLLAFYAHSCGACVVLSAFARVQQLLLGLWYEYQSCAGPITGHLAAFAAHSGLAIKELLEELAIGHFELVVA